MKDLKRMEEKRGRKPIKASVIRKIYSDALKYKSTTRRTLAFELKKDFEEMGEFAPSEEYMIKMISKARNHAKSPLDELWDLSTLTLPEYSIPAEAVPIVMSVWEMRWNQRNVDQFLTIREALWVSRLYKLVEAKKLVHLLPELLPPELESKIALTSLVDEWAFVYAQREKLSEIDNELFDTSDLNFHMIENVYEYWGNRRFDALHDIADNYGLGVSDYYKMTTLNIPISEIEEIVKSGNLSDIVASIFSGIRT
ncbi:hypothetical protein ACFLWF_00005 [Chloroflexota bacterium]